MQFTALNSSITCSSNTLEPLTLQPCDFSHAVTLDDREQGFTAVVLAVEGGEVDSATAPVTYQGSDRLNVTQDARMTVVLEDTAIGAHLNNGRLFGNCMGLHLQDSSMLRSMHKRVGQPSAETNLCSRLLALRYASIINNRCVVLSWMC